MISAVTGQRPLQAGPMGRIVGPGKTSHERVKIAHGDLPEFDGKKSGWLDLNQRSPVPKTGGISTFPHPEKASANCSAWNCNTESKAPSGSRTHTFAMARQQATATSWAQFLATELSKIKLELLCESANLMFGRHPIAQICQASLKQ